MNFMTFKRKTWTLNLSHKENVLRIALNDYKKRRKIAKHWITDSKKRGDYEVVEFYRREASLCYYVIRALKHEIAQIEKVRIQHFGDTYDFEPEGELYTCLDCYTDFAMYNDIPRYCPCCGKKAKIV